MKKNINNILSVLLALVLPTMLALSAFVVRILVPVFTEKDMGPMVRWARIRMKY